MSFLSTKGRFKVVLYRFKTRNLLVIQSLILFNLPACTQNNVCDINTCVWKICAETDSISVSYFKKIYRYFVTISLTWHDKSHLEFNSLILKPKESCEVLSQSLLMGVSSCFDLMLKTNAQYVMSVARGSFIKTKRTQVWWHCIVGIVDFIADETLWLTQAGMLMS